MSGVGGRPRRRDQPEDQPQAQHDGDEQMLKDPHRENLVIIGAAYQHEVGGSEDEAVTSESGGDDASLSLRSDLRVSVVGSGRRGKIALMLSRHNEGAGMLPLQVDENVELRLLSDDDAEAFFDLIIRDRARLDNWMRWTAQVQTLDDARAYH